MNYYIMSSIKIMIMGTLAILFTSFVVGCSAKPSTKAEKIENKVLRTKPIQQGEEPWKINLNHGWKLFEGDIVNQPPVHESSSRNALNNQNNLWKNSEIPYSIEGSYNYDERLAIDKGLAEIGGRTCNTFRAKESGDINFIAIVRGNGCYSSVGMVGGRQTLSLGDGCVTRGTIQHEAMHAIGFWHEHSRYDRDGFVEIMWENIIPGEEPNFEKYSEDTTTTLGLDYDYGSIMHYGSTYFSKNGEDTIVLSEESKDSGVNAAIGTQGFFTDLDITKQRTLYECDEDQFVGWSAWSVWSECDTDCIQQRWRWCNSDECSGEDQQSQACSDCELGHDPDCGISRFTGRVGSISSSMYPSNYKNYADCTYTIIADDPKVPVYVSFIRFGIEYEPTTCGYDYLAIYKNGVGPAEEYLCGSALPEDHTYEVDSLEFMFHSDSSVNDIGFRILYFNAPVIDLWGFEKSSDEEQWTQATDDDFDWTRYSGSTPSAGTGPHFDHTFDDQNGHYMYIETSSPQYGRVTATLLSPIINPISEDACVQFYYHMYGEYMGTLNVFVMEYESNGAINTRLIMSTDGDQGVEWQMQQFTPPQNKKFQMQFDAVRGSGYLSDIALDDVGIFGFKCDAE